MEKQYLISKLKSIIHLNKQIGAHNKGNAELLEKYANRIKESYDSLKKSIDELNKNKFICVLRIK